MIYKLLESIEISGANSNTRNVNSNIKSSLSWTPGYTVFLIQSTSIVTQSYSLFNTFMPTRKHIDIHKTTKISFPSITNWIAWWQRGKGSKIYRGARSLASTTKRKPLGTCLYDHCFKPYLTSQCNRQHSTSKFPHKHPRLTYQG